MLFITLLITILALTNAAAIEQICAGRGGNTGTQLTFSTEEGGIMSPCENVPFESRVCTVLKPGSIANRAVKMYPPVGVWICAVFRAQNCVDEHNPYIQRGAGLYLPDSLKGHVGAVYCERKH